MKKYQVNIGGALVDVTEEQYIEYYRAKRRMRYYENDIKTETAIRDKQGRIVGYAPSKEDSLDRFLSKGEDFYDESEFVEDLVINRLMQESLYKALKILTLEEHELIKQLFFANSGSGMTERECAEKFGVSKTALHARKIKVLTKLKNLIENNFQNS